MKLQDEATETEFDFSDSASRLWRPAFLCLILIAIELFALLYDFDHGPDGVASRSKVLGRYDSGSNSVRKKNSGTIAWFLPESGESIRNRDSILTLGESQASVSFNDGTTMRVAPDSLVSFEEHSLNLLEGTIENSSPLSVKVGEAVITNSGGDAKFKVSRNKAGGVTVKVSAGSVAVMKAGRKIASVETSQAAAIDLERENVTMNPPPEVPVEPVRFRLDPAQTVGLAARDNIDTPLTLEMQAAFDATKLTTDEKALVKFELAKDAAFETVVSSKEIEISAQSLATAAGNATMKADLEKIEDGDFYWRAKVTRGGAESDLSPALIKLRTRTTPQIEGPDNRERLKKGMPLYFRWKVDENRTAPDGFEIEVSSVSDFSNVIHNLESTKKELRWVAPAKGEYYWRVRSLYWNIDGQSVGPSGWSEPRQFEVTRKEKLRAPKLRSPRVKILRTTTESRRWEIFQSAWGDDAPATGIPLDIQVSWEPMEEAKGYRVQISQDENFERLLVDKRTPSSGVKGVIRVARPNPLYFRVAAIDDEGELGYYSAVEKIELDRFDPEIKSKLAQKPESWRLDLALGAAYHSRNFKNDASPNEALGAAMIPAFGSCALEFKLGPTAELTLYGNLLAEKAEATNLPTSMKVDAQGVPLIRAWTQIGWGAPKSPTNWAIGAYGATTHEFSFVDLKLKAEQKILMGIHLEVGSRRVRRKNALRWRLDLGLIGVGAKGVDIGGELAWSLSSKRKDGFYRGFYFGFEPLGRFADIETYYGAVAKVGYEF